MQNAAEKPRKTYDPGTPGEIRHMGDLQFAVQSFRDEESWYAVDLRNGTCTCPHGTLRDPKDGCKHYRQAKAEHLNMVREKARTMTAAQLRACLSRYSYRPEVEDAIKEVIFEKLYALVDAVQQQVKSREHCRI